MNWDIYEGHLRTLIHHNEQWAAGHLAGAASGKFADLADWNEKIQAVVSEELDKTWLHKPRSYKLLVPRAGASK